MMVSVIMAAVLPPETVELPNPPNPGAFLPCLSASRRACCNSFALRRISALASRSWVYEKRHTYMDVAFSAVYTTNKNRKIQIVKMKERQTGSPRGETIYLSDCSEHLLLMRIHFCEGSDLCQVNILPVSQGNNFIKSKYQIKTVIRYFILL